MWINQLPPGGKRGLGALAEYLKVSAGRKLSKTKEKAPRGRRGSSRGQAAPPLPQPPGSRARPGLSPAREARADPGKRAAGGGTSGDSSRAGSDPHPSRAETRAGSRGAEIRGGARTRVSPAEGGAGLTPRRHTLSSRIAIMCSGTVRAGAQHPPGPGPRPRRASVPQSPPFPPGARGRNRRRCYFWAAGPVAVGHVAACRLLPGLRVWPPRPLGTPPDAVSHPGAALAECPLPQTRSAAGPGSTEPRLATAPPVPLAEMPDGAGRQDPRWRDLAPRLPASLMIPLLVWKVGTASWRHLFGSTSESVWFCLIIKWHSRFPVEMKPCMRQLLGREGG